MPTKEETITKVYALMREACRYWDALDGLASRKHIETEQKRIHQEAHAIIEYIKTHA